MKALELRKLNDKLVANQKIQVPNLIKAFACLLLLSCRRDKGFLILLNEPRNWKREKKKRFDLSWPQCLILTTHSLWLISPTFWHSDWEFGTGDQRFRIFHPVSLLLPVRSLISSFSSSALSALLSLGHGTKSIHLTCVKRSRAVWWSSSKEEFPNHLARRKADGEGLERLTTQGSNNKLIDWD
jgi:hypothetical protein